MNVLSDWRPAPNIRNNPEIYERENQALARDGRLDRALAELAPTSGRVVLDIGCGTGFWIPRSPDAARVIGVEPDPELLERARDRLDGSDRLQVLRGSAEHLPLPDRSVEVALARFAYFFGPGAERGLREVQRVLRPGGVFVAIDNSWRWGELAELLRDATGGNADLDPEATDTWWQQQGAERVEVQGGWQARTPEELEQILRIEFPSSTVDRWVARHPHRASLTYGFALFVWRADP